MSSRELRFIPKLVISVHLNGSLLSEVISLEPYVFKLYNTV